MKYSEAKQGRVFIIRLEDGDILHEKVEEFAREKFIKAAALIAVGGIDKESKLVVGPDKKNERPVKPLTHILDDVHEVAGTGTIFPDEEGNPVLHMHLACVREGSTITGCVRTGVKVWHILEVVLYELTDTEACRIFDHQTGFALLRP